MNQTPSISTDSEISRDSKSVNTETSVCSVLEKAKSSTNHTSSTEFSPNRFHQINHDPEPSSRTSCDCANSMDVDQPDNDSRLLPVRFDDVVRSHHNPLGTTKRQCCNLDSTTKAEESSYNRRLNRPLQQDRSSPEETSNHGVILEFPQNGFPHVVEHKSDSSSLPSSFIRNINDTKISSSDSGTLASWSYVNVDANQPGDDSRSLSSSWSYLTSAVDQTRDNKFDIVCLDSGSYVKKCKHCTYHNPLVAEICDCCNFGFNIDTDEQIAIALQDDEEDREDDLEGRYNFDVITEIFLFLSKFPNDGLWTLEKDELSKSALPFIKAVVDGGAKLSLMYYVTSFGHRPQVQNQTTVPYAAKTFLPQPPTPSTLPPPPLIEQQLPNRLPPLSKRRQRERRGYARELRTRSLQTKREHRTYAPFTDNIDTAFVLALSAKLTPRYHGDPIGSWSPWDHYNSLRLPPILEDKAAQRYANYGCWIMATVRFEKDGTVENVVRAPRSGHATTYKLGHPELALPLVQLEYSLCQTDIVRVLYNGLSKILQKQFGLFEGFENRHDYKTAGGQTTMLDESKTPAAVSFAQKEEAE